MDDWKIHAQAHMSTLRDEMFVVTDGPSQIMKVKTVYLIDPSVDQFIPKPKMEWTS